MLVCQAKATTEDSGCKSVEQVSGTAACPTISTLLLDVVLELTNWLELTEE